MTKFYDKLIRDRIPAILRDSGKAFKTRIATPEEFEPYAIKKLKEELDEFKESLAVEELADLLEVVYAIARGRGLSAADLEDLRLRKAKERGGFEQRVVLIEAD